MTARSPLRRSVISRSSRLGTRLTAIRLPSASLTKLEENVEFIIEIYAKSAVDKFHYKSKYEKELEEPWTSDGVAEVRAVAS